MIMKNLAMSHRIEIYVRVCDGKFVYATCWELYMKFAQTCAMIRRSDPIRSDPIRSDSVQIRFGSNPIQSLRSDRIRSNRSGPIRSDLIPSVCFTCMSCHKTFNPRIDTATEYYMDSELNPLSNARQFNVQLNER